jgi:hypothetical protein
MALVDLSEIGVSGMQSLIDVVLQLVFFIWKVSSMLAVLFQTISTVM